MPEDGGSPTEKNAADEPLVPRKENPITSEGNSGSESKDGNPRPHWADRIIAIFTGLIFLTYIGSNYFACRQMRLTKAAIDQSATNNAAAILAQQQIAQQSLSVSQENFRKSLDTTTEQLRLDQRAWLGVDGVSGEPKEKERWEITVAIKNTGKTPAKDVGFLASLHVIDKGEALTFDYSSVKGEASKAMLPPGSVYRSNPPTPESLINEADIQSIKKESVAVYVYGKGTYIDIFSCRHWITYCYHMLPDAKSWAVCKQYNDTGDDKCNPSQPAK